MVALELDKAERNSSHYDVRDMDERNTVSDVRFSTRGRVDYVLGSEPP
jgi:hypothetical protein